MSLPPGLVLINDFITKEEHDRLISFLDNNIWHGCGVEPNGELKRRTQQFGALFRFKTRTIEEIWSIPEEFDCFKNKFKLIDIFQKVPFDHIMVNEYQKYQGIMPHIDSTVVFGDTIACLSLLSDCVMNFKRKDDEEWDVYLPKRSLIIFQGESRFNMTHSISKNDFDKIGDLLIERERRVSVTFRTIK
jgi:alkylated DNA repair dioxygenase AlkB